MKSFLEYLRYLEDAPQSSPDQSLGAPPGVPPAESPDAASMASMPGSATGAPPGLPMGGGAPDPMMGAGPPTGGAPSNEKGPLKLKAYNVWDVLEKILK